MAFRRRGFRRRRFGARGVARKEPVWITTAYDITVPPNLLTQQLFQLIGPEDYTPDYVAEPQRRDKATLYRTVGSFSMLPNIPADKDGILTIAWKAALFVAGDKQIDDAFAADPTQFDIVNPGDFPPFCRDFSPIHIFWSEYFTVANAIVGGSTTEFKTEIWYPPATSGRKEWDVTVRRKLVGDDALWLLVNCSFLQSPPQEIGGSVDVEARNLIMDQ